MRKAFQVYKCMLVYVSTGVQLVLYKFDLQNKFTPRWNVHQCTHVHLEARRRLLGAELEVFLGKNDCFLMYVCTYVNMYKRLMASFAMARCTSRFPGVHRVSRCTPDVHQCTPGKGLR